jgi:hypothetical protein
MTFQERIASVTCENCPLRGVPEEDWRRLCVVEDGGPILDLTTERAFDTRALRTALIVASWIDAVRNGFLLEGAIGEIDRDAVSLTNNPEIESEISTDTLSLTGWALIRCFKNESDNSNTTESLIPKIDAATGASILSALLEFKGQELETAVYLRQALARIALLSGADLDTLSSISDATNEQIFVAVI